LGRIVDVADRNTLYSNPQHPYTRALLSSVPVPNPDIQQDRIVLEGDLPSPSNPPTGCTFHPRCPLCIEECKTKSPSLEQTESDHYVSCILVAKGES